MTKIYLLLWFRLFFTTIQGLWELGLFVLFCGSPYTEETMHWCKIWAYNFESNSKCPHILATYWNLENFKFYPIIKVLMDFLSPKERKKERKKENVQLNQVG
jgi:hypothetical protein